jgi:hypothetical protein
MKTLSAGMAILWLALALPHASAQPARELKWQDLAPPMSQFDDPFVSLSPEQKIDLAMVSVVRQLQARNDPALGPEQMRSYNETLARLKKANIDVDGLLAKRAELMEKRRREAEAVNEKLNGQRVRLPGYVLPLEMDGKKVTEFLLVPYVGACIHAPTPPANQIVHVKHAKGFEAQGLFTPVWVQGVMRTMRSEPKLNLVDGTANIPTGYALDAQVVDPYRE